MTDPLTAPAIIVGWKILGALSEKYQAWSGRKKTSKEAQKLNAQAEKLMASINAAILSGASSDDPQLAPLVQEFRALVESDVKPTGFNDTQAWIDRSRRSSGAPKKPAAKKAAAKPIAKSAAPKKPVAKKAAAKPIAKSAAPKKPAAKKASPKKA